MRSTASPETRRRRGLGVALKLIYFWADVGAEKGFLRGFLSFFWWANNYIYNSTRQGWSLMIGNSISWIWMRGQVLGMKIVASSLFVAVEKQGIRCFYWGFWGGHFGLENDGHQLTSLTQSETNWPEGMLSAGSSQNWRMFWPDNPERRIVKQIDSYLLLFHIVCEEGRNFGKLERFWGKANFENDMNAIFTELRMGIIKFARRKDSREGSKD